MKDKYIKMLDKLVKRNQYFSSLNETYIGSKRIIGVNDFDFKIDDDYRSDRENIWFFSDDFALIVNDFCDNTNEKKIYELFLSKKDTLKDLSWIVDGYY